MAEVTTVKSERTENPGALDAPTDMAKLVQPAEGGYMEDPDHRPTPTDQYGTMDTSDTAGGAQNSINEIAPIFRAARAQNMVAAARALDPDDDTPAELVTLPQGSVTVTGAAKTADEGREEIATALRKLGQSPIELGGPSPEAQKAGQEDPDATADRGQTMSASMEGGGEPATKGTTQTQDAGGKEPAKSATQNRTTARPR